MISLRNFRLFNPEWFRNPSSRLEETLRTPIFIRNGAVLLANRILFPWLLFTIIVWSITGDIRLAALGPIFILIYELLVLKNWYEKKILKQHLKNIELVKTIAEKSKDKSINELRDDIGKSVRLACWGLIRIGYVGLAAWGWEIIFRAFYPFLIKTQQIDYRDLLVGFKNKNVEADQALWKVAQEKNEQTQKEKLEEYLENYGSKVEDIDLAFPTFRENQKAVNSFLKLYTHTTSPLSTLKKAKEKRLNKTRIVLKRLRIPKPIFNWLLKTVQSNVRLREDRRYYHFLADFNIRQMIINLGRKLNLNEKDVFNKSWRELKNASS